MGPKKKVKLTRAQASETLFGGGPKDLIDTSIPTYRDIARYFYFIESTEKKIGIQIMLLEKLVKKYLFSHRNLMKWKSNDI